MKKMISILCAMLVVLPLISNAADNPKIAFVNGMEILQKYNPDIDKKLEKEFGKRKNEIISLQNDIKDKVEKLRKDEAILSASKARDLKRDIEAKQLDYKQLTADFQEDYNLARNKALQMLSDKIEKVITKIAKQKQFDVVLQSQSAVFVDKKLDITSEVLAAVK